MGDKDAAGIVEALAPAISAAVVHRDPAGAARRRGPAWDRPRSQRAELAALFEAAGVPATVEPDPDRAIASGLRSAHASAAGWR